jgi:cysteine-rich repeat protein
MHHARLDLFTSAALATALLTAAPASANYPDAIPNGYSSPSVGRCGVCHVSSDGGGELTSFGTDFQLGQDGVAFNSDDHRWTRWLAARDSDGDGWSNGQELGDPFANWSSGGTPAHGYQGNPGNSSSEPSSTLNLCGTSAWNDCATFATGGTCTDVYSGSGRWGCGCRSGFTGSGHRRTSSHNWISGVRQRYTIASLVSSGCSDVNECATVGRCGVGSCTNLTGTYRCSCPPGYQAPPTGGTCIDVNECATPGICGLGSCTNSTGSYSCSCPSGYSFDGTTCVVNNACTANVDDCDRNATCTPVGTMDWTCTCNAGYRGTGTSFRGTGDRCVDIDECSETPRVCSPGTCTNTLGRYRCTCPSGYRGQPSGGSCVDIDECSELAGICDVGTCSNRGGSYTCSCPAGYVFDGTTCADVNECASDPCGAGECVQRFPPPGYGCACRSGYEFDGTTCRDVDECEDPVLNLCSSNASCANTPGSFTCTCDPGYQGDGFNCVDIMECAPGVENECDENATCENTPGGYGCLCNEGFEGSGITCTDVNECERGTHGCGINEACVNQIGMPNTCECSPGYERQGTRCVGACGNGERTAGEQCDDGNDTDGDGCSTACDVEPGWACFESDGGASDCERTCGDGLIQAPAEACDDGEANSDTEPDACRTRCLRAHCGDGVVDTGESCDEGSANSDIAPDRCRSMCQRASCGDGVVDTGESFDPGGGARGRRLREPLRRARRCRSRGWGRAGRVRLPSGRQRAVTARAGAGGGLARPLAPPARLRRPLARARRLRDRAVTTLRATPSARRGGEDRVQDVVVLASQRQLAPAEPAPGARLPPILGQHLELRLHVRREERGGERGLAGQPAIDATHGSHSVASLGRPSRGVRGRQRSGAVRSPARDRLHRQARELHDRSRVPRGLWQAVRSSTLRPMKLTRRGLFSVGLGSLLLAVGARAQRGGDAALEGRWTGGSRGGPIASTRTWTFRGSSYEMSGYPSIAERGQFLVVSNVRAGDGGRSLRLRFTAVMRCGPCGSSPMRPEDDRERTVQLSADRRTLTIDGMLLRRA